MFIPVYHTVPNWLEHLSDADVRGLNQRQFLEDADSGITHFEMKWIEHCLKADSSHPLNASSIEIIGDLKERKIVVTLETFMHSDKRKELELFLSSIFSSELPTPDRPYVFEVLSGEVAHSLEFEGDIIRLEQNVVAQLSLVLERERVTKAQLEVIPTAIIGNLQRGIGLKTWKLVFNVLVRADDGVNEVLNLISIREKLIIFLDTIYCPAVENIGNRINVSAVPSMPDIGKVVHLS